jgi:hypothetical protein
MHNESLRVAFAESRAPDFELNGSNVERGWRDTALTLAAGGDRELAERVQRFVDQMPTPKTGSEMLLQGVLARDPTRKIEPDARTR